VPVLRYTLLRLALFAIVTAVLWAAGARSWLAPLAGLFVAWALSYVLFGKQRAAAAAWVEQRAEQRGTRRRTPADEDAALEDAADEAARARRTDDARPDEA